MSSARKHTTFICERHGNMETYVSIFEFEKVVAIFFDISGIIPKPYNLVFSAYVFSIEMVNAVI